MDADAIYLSKVENFERLYDDRVDTAVSLLGGDPQSVREIETARAIVKAAIAELLQFYRDLFIERSPALGKDAPLRFTRLEANIAMAVQQTLDAMRKLIGLQSAPAPIRRVRSRVLRNAIRKINASLARREPAAPLSPVVGFQEMMLAGRKRAKTAAIIVALVGLHRSVSHWPKWLDPSNFFRSDDIVYAGTEQANAQLAASPHRVMVVVGNHDGSTYDGSIANRMAHKLGTGHHIVMARKGVYPIPPPESTGDVVYVDEDDPNSYPIAESVARVKEYLGKREVVSIAVYPEGMLAFTGAQMPMVAKEGAYIVARKIAIELRDQGVPVYLVELKSNILPHLTEPEYVDAEVRVTSVELVPAEPMVKGQPDEWIARHRLVSQTLYNQDRGEKMIDLADITPIPGSITFQARGLLRHSEIH